MFIINDDDSIELTRGDTAYIDLTVEDYIFKVGDEILFSVKKRATDEEYIFQKKIIIEEENEMITIKISSNFTKEAKFGDYVYDIQLTQKVNGDISTVVPINKFTIAKEVS